MRAIRSLLPLFAPLAIAGCFTGESAIPRDKVTVDSRARAAEIVPQIDAAIEKKDYLVATELADEIDDTDPYTPTHAMAVARARAAAASSAGNPRQYHDAIQRATAAVEAAPDDPKLRTQRGRLEFDRKYYGKAIEDFTRAIELEPSNLEARRYLAFCYQHLRKPRSERKAWEGLLSIKADDADANYFLAAVLLRDGDTSDPALGEEYLKKTIAIQPKHRLALQALGYLEWSRKDYVNAEAHLAAAVSAPEDAPIAPVNIPVTAQATATNAAIDPNDPEAQAPNEEAAREAEVLYSLGAVRQAAGKNKEAADAYERALTFDPLHAKASANLGVLLLDLGDADQGLRRLRDALLTEKDEDVKTTLEKLIKAQEAKIDAEIDSAIPGPNEPAPAAPPPGSGKPTTPSAPNVDPVPATSGKG